MKFERFSLVRFMRLREKFTWLSFRFFPVDYCLQKVHSKYANLFRFTIPMRAYCLVLQMPFGLRKVCNFLRIRTFKAPARGQRRQKKRKLFYRLLSQHCRMQLLLFVPWNQAKSFRVSSVVCKQYGLIELPVVEFVCVYQNGRLVAFYFFQPF